MDEETTAGKLVLCMAYRTAGFQQLRAFIAETDVHAHRVRMAPLFYLICKMVYIHHSLRAADGMEFFQQNTEQGPSANGDQCFGHTVRQGLEACAQPGGKNHRFHRAG